MGGMYKIWGLRGLHCVRSSCKLGEMRMLCSMRGVCTVCRLCNMRRLWTVCNMDMGRYIMRLLRGLSTFSVICKIAKTHKLHSIRPLRTM